MEFEKLQNIICEVLDVEPEKVTMETSFIDDLGADSLDLSEIIMEVENVFEITIPDTAFEAIKTVGDAVEQIKNA